MTLADIEQDLYDRFGYQSTPPTEISRRMLRFINESHRELLGKKWASSFRRALLTFSTVANSPFAVLPHAVSRILVIADRTNSWPLREVTLDDLRYEDPALTATSAFPDRYVILNYAAAVAKDPSNPSELFVASSDAADTTQTVYIEGITSGGYLRSTTVTLTGTTAVSINAAITDWIAVTKFYLSAVAAGYITLLEDSGAGTEMARITIGRTYSRYTRLHMYPTPSAASTYYADVDRAVPDLANAMDEPLIHEDWHWLLVCGAARKEYRKRENEPATQGETTRWNEGLRDMQTFLSQRSGVATGQQRGAPRHSQLGPMFRAGT